MNGAMDYNWLGVAFVSEKLGSEVEEAVENEMERLRDAAMEEFDRWLDARGLEQVMGVIVKKGSVK